MRERKAETKMILQGSSPDEVALVKYANSLGMELVERDRKHVQLRNPKMIYENYEILAEFPFSSQSKKMSVLVKHRETDKIIYYTKGAEIVLESMVKQQQKGILLELCEQLAREGLRTLVFAQKEITK
jgi:phospholipid-translocating ATPase